jgi:adenylate kinase
VHITTGGNFRKFTLGESFAAKKASALASEGSLLPEFLGIWNWSNIFIETLQGNETVILDGAPRRMAEVEALHSALKFYEYDHATVIYLDVSATWALDKLASRKREDDTKPEFAEKKMEWFDTDVLPVLDMYSRDPRFTYVHINGEQTVEEVHEELLDKVFSLQ